MTLIETPGARIHVVEQGEGPLVLLIHGFPEGAWAWRHQLPALAAAGFRAAAIDVRGYGRSSAPADVEAYRMLTLVADAVAVVRALGDETATVIGHDWGSTIAAACALLRPDVFTAVGLLGVPYEPPGGPRPTDVLAHAGGDEEFYVSYFQAPGRAEEEIAGDVRGWLAGFYAALRAAPRRRLCSPSRPAAGCGTASRHGARRPGWTSASSTPGGRVRAHGLTGALNRYRNMDRDWEDLAAWQGEPIRQRLTLPRRSRTPPRRGWPARSKPTPQPSRASPPPTCSTVAATGSSRSAPDEVNALLLEWL